LLEKKKNNNNLQKKKKKGQLDIYRFFTLLSVEKPNQLVRLYHHSLNWFALSTACDKANQAQNNVHNFYYRLTQIGMSLFVLGLYIYTPRRCI